MIIICVIIISIFFALNMGASGIAPSFAASWGSNLIKRRDALLLFGLFVMLGGVLLSRNVSTTLGKKLIPQEFITPPTALIILGSATASLFLANILKIPQSTSQVTVGAIIGAGLYFGRLHWHTLLLKIIPMWVVLPLFSYGLTFMLYKIIYPPRHDNLGIYQKLFANQRKLKISSIVASCYVAFAIGSNNVANAVGPIYGAGLIDVTLGLVLISPLFGLGALLMGKGTIETAGKGIIPLGLFSSTLVSFVTASLLIFASILGIPQSLVQLNLCSILAISSIKDGHRLTWDRHTTKKTLLIWSVTPVLSVILSYLACLFLNISRN